MIAIEPITPLNTFLFKAVRLRALQDVPHAFGSTYAKELQLTDSDWINRVERWNGERGAGFLATDGDTACGIAGSFLDQHDATRAHLISMWTAPTHRHRGIGRLLVNHVLNWARGRNALILQLMVTSNNDPAIRFYQPLEFTLTGRTEPYPNDPDCNRIRDVAADSVRDSPIAIAVPPTPSICMSRNQAVFLALASRGGASAAGGFSKGSSGTPAPSMVSKVF
jgi:ribosomal protein S18 acetylase RimI-like enzyme